MPNDALANQTVQRLLTGGEMPPDEERAAIELIARAQPRAMPQV